MTDLYSKASLILTSNAFSASKAYAIKPATGTGDFTFLRNTASGSRIKSDGSIEFVNANVPRLNYNSVQLANTNLLRYSNDFSSWSSANTTINSNSITSPDGTLNGYKISEVDTSPTQHYLYQSVTAFPNLFTFSLFVKAAERSWIRLSAYGASSNDFINFPYVSFNLSNGTIGTYSLCNPKIESVGNGWYRCTMQSNVLLPQTLNSTAISVQVDIANADNSVDYAGLPGSGLYVYGAQLETTTTSSATTYIPTTTAAGSSTATAGAPSFLLEPQRTNLLSYSNTFNDTSWYRPQGFISASIITSPEGILNGWKLNEMTAAPLISSFSTLVTADGGTIQASSCIQNSIGALLGNVFSITRPNNFGVFTNGTRYVCSAYVKPAQRTAIAIETNLNGTDYTKFNLTGTGSVISTQAGLTGSITQEYGGWFRISAAGTMADSTTAGLFSLTMLSGSNYTASYYTSGSETNGVYIYGAQVESGSYVISASSYIPTTTAAATSNEDLLYKNGLQSTFCTSIWTVFLDYNVSAPIQDAMFSYTLDTLNGLLWYLVKTPTGIRGYDYKNSATLFNNVTSANASKIAITSDGTIMTVYVNGTSIGTYTPSNPGTLSIDEILFEADDTSLLTTPTTSTSIKNFILYPTALSAVECLTLTSLST